MQYVVVGLVVLLVFFVKEFIKSRLKEQRKTKQDRKDRKQKIVLLESTMAHAAKQNLKDAGRTLYKADLLSIGYEPFLDIFWEVPNPELIARTIITRFKYCTQYWVEGDSYNHRYTKRLAEKLLELLKVDPSKTLKIIVHLVSIDKELAGKLTDRLK